MIMMSFKWSITGIVEQIHTIGLPSIYAGVVHKFSSIG